MLVLGSASLVAAVVVSGYGAWAAKEGFLRADASRQLELDNQDLMVGMLDQESGLRGYVITDNETFLEPYIRGRLEVQSALGKLAAGVHDPELQRELGAARELAGTWQVWAEKRKASVTASGGAMGDLTEARAGKAIFDAFRVAHAQFQSTLDSGVNQDIAGARTGQRVGFGLLLAAGLIAGLILAALGRTLTSRTLRPIASLAASARELAAGRPALVMVTSRTDEIGDLSRALAAWQAAARDRDHMFTLSDDIFAVAGFDGFFKSVNPAWERISGITAAEFTSKPYLDFVHPDDRASTIAEGGKLAEGVKTISFRNRYICKDGSYRWLDWTAVPVQGEEVIYCVARDVTSQKESEDAIKALNKELEAFSYSVSHDLRAPLRAIHGFVRILVEEYGAEVQGEARRYLDLVAANANQMGRLVDDLLQFSRMGRQALNKQRVSVAAAVRRALEQLEPAMEGRAIEMTVGELPEAEADPTLLNQVFLNLIGNAVKYTKGKQSAHIEVGARTEANGEIVYFVRDNGAGFDMQYAHKLFGVFQRLHRAEDYEGTGVGLALVQRIISKHGGRIWAEAAVDKGATFFFTLGGAPTWELKMAA